jgi:hypothetical protein
MQINLKRINLNILKIGKIIQDILEKNSSQQNNQQSEEKTILKNFVELFHIFYLLTKISTRNFLKSH